VITNRLGYRSPLPYQLPALDELIFVKTNVGGYFFDAFFKINHTLSVKATEHPVMTGANITDHSYIEPNQLNMDIGMSDAMRDLVQGQFGTNGAAYDRFTRQPISLSRSVEAAKLLRQIATQRIPLQVVTRLRVYQNMLITGIVEDDDYTKLYGWRASVTFKEILVANVKTVKVSRRPQTTDGTDKGQVVPEKAVDESLLSRGASLFGGVR